MKKIILLSALCVSVLTYSANAQSTNYSEAYGKTVNIGLGIGGYSGYYGYIGRTLPVFHIDYEFDVAHNFTLAPFIGLYSYGNTYYWGDPGNNHPYKYYHYRETVITAGLKGTYYFDQLLHANPKW